MNYAIEASSLIDTLKKHGFVPFQLNNGEERIPANSLSESELIEELTAVDESKLTVLAESGESCILFIVLGNEPGEMVCDYTSFDKLETAVEEHYDKWAIS
jgi:hypothetical protein